MLLLSRIIRCEVQSIEAEVDIDATSPFADGEQGVPRWVGIEFMAQAVGALDGAKEKQVGHAIMPGYLLGTRRIDHIGGHFAYGSILRIRAQTLLADESGFGSYDCQIDEGDNLIRCQLTVYRKPAVGSTRA